MNIDREQKTLTISQGTGITVSVTLVLMFAGAIFTGATWLSEMRNRTSNLELTSERLNADVSKLNTESTTNQVKFTEIQTQLKSIDTTLLEIKERLR